MIEWLTDPEFLDDAALLRESNSSDGTGDRAEALIAEIERCNLEPRTRLETGGTQLSLWEPGYNILRRP